MLKKTIVLMSFILLLAACVGLSTDVFAAPSSTEGSPENASAAGSTAQTGTGTDVSGKKSNTVKWVKKKGCYYCYLNGKKLTNGIHLVDRKKYCFDKKGRQLTGWRKVGKHAFYFRCLNGKNGYMLTGRKVDGIRLKKNGFASPKGARAKKKLPILLKVQKLTDKAVTPSMSKSKKLRACFRYVMTHFDRANISDLGHMRSNWDLDYASFILNAGYGDCYCEAAVFAYFANAVGYTNVLSVNSGGHGWVEIKGQFYDPNWAHVIGTDKCFACPASLSGSGGRPNWAAYGLYYSNCDK